MIEKIIWYLVVLDCLIYAIMTFSANYHSKKKHYFWKVVPLNNLFAVYYILLVAWLGFALLRLNVLW